jgi:macrolide transport system ATP-binding/permease protein
MLELNKVSKIYRMGDNEVFALKDIDLKIEAGDFVAIMGPSGSGKSTMMNLLGLLDVPSSGEYKIAGRAVSGLNESDLALLRRETIGFIFQQFNLLPRMSAVENVALPQFYTAPGADRSRSRELLNQVGLGSRMEHKTQELSGGQQQRVAIARSLVNAPAILFADEPTGNLDSKSEKDIMKILKDLNAQGITIVVVTHEEEIGDQARRRIRMRDGEIESDERLLPLETHGAQSTTEGAGKDRSGGWLLQLSELLKQALRTLWSSRIRTALSMLGILIGVAAVITMLAIGSGAKNQIEKQLSSLGSNLLILRPGTKRVGGVSQQTGTTRLTPADVQAIRELSFVKSASPTLSGRVQATYLNKNWNTEVNGAEPSYARMHASVPVQGRFFSEEENQSRAMVAVIGRTVARELFGDQNPLGQTFKVNKVNLQVIGVLPAKGTQGPRDQDDVVLVPVQTAMRRLLGRVYIDSIEVEIDTATMPNLDLASDRLIEYMAERYHMPNSDANPAFRVFNLAELQEALASSSKTMSSLLASIAAISLLVGGIGIMNIMLVSVTERTREIGLRKAIGARPVDILVQFIVESVVLTLIGGLFGIALGWAATLAVGRTVGWATNIEISSILLSFVFSVSIGLIFGIYPAKRASSLNPIEALRHE